MAWSPDSSQLLISFGETDNLLIDADHFNDLDSVPDVTARLSLIFSQWEQELVQQEMQKLVKLPPEMQEIATASAKNIYFSPDEKKMFYTASAQVTIPDDLIPKLPASSTQQQERQLDPGGIYVYDLKEDRNFRIDTQESTPAELGEPPALIDKVKLVTEIVTPQSLLQTTPEASPSAYRRLQTNRSVSESIESLKLEYSPLNLNGYQWFPDSAHLTVSNASGVQVVEYDGTNRATLYSGPREASFLYSWPNGSKLLIWTNLGASEDVPLNLYAISLK